MQGGFTVVSAGLYRTSGKARNPEVLPCRDCDAETTARCSSKGTPLCNVCKHLQKTRGWDDEPVTERHPSLDSFRQVSGKGAKVVPISSSLAHSRMPNRG